MTTTPLMDTSELDQQWLDEMNSAMQDGGGIQLPFDFAIAWPHNGDRKMAQFAADFPVTYYGGFHLDDDGLVKLDEAGKLGVPLASLPWKHTQMTRDDGTTYTVYETRILNISMIAYRMSWLSKEGRTRSPIYTPATPRSHIQYLALIGAKNAEGKIVPLCPAVITAKGKGQTEALKNAIAVWRKGVDQHRKALGAQNIPLSGFWLSIGTSGDPVFEAVGNGEQRHMITPMKAVMPQQVTAENIAARFVGKDTLKYAHELLTQAKPWITAWQTGAISSNNDYTPATQGAGRTQPQPQGGNEIPF